MYDTINKEINNSKGYDEKLDKILNITYNNISKYIPNLITLIETIRMSKPQHGGNYNYIQNKCSYYKLLSI